jgi:two-component system, sensor histidine kinase and response regulator
MSDETRMLTTAVVDDEPGMRSGACRVLEDLRIDLDDIREKVCFAPSAYSTGEGFLAALSQQQPDILLLDCKLPGVGGLEILERLSAERLDTVTVMATAYATLETAIRATKLGAYDLLAKPFTPDELRATMRKAARNIILTRKARRLAEERRKVRFQFISVLAHELKSPLNAVDGYLDIVLNRRAGDDESAYRDMLERSRIRLGGMRKLVNDLLDLTRIESGQKRRSLESLSMNELAASLLETHRVAADTAHVDLVLQCEPGLAANADRGEIEMILNNLITNAVKYNRPGGSVSVHIGASADGVRLAVEDTGIGMTPEEVSRLFGEFSRIKNENTRGIPGSGLGLSIVKKLALLYDGDVGVSSEPGVGTRFTVLLRTRTPQTAE